MKSYPKYYGLLGGFLIVVSFIHWYLPFTNSLLLFFNSLFMLGNIFLFDCLSYELKGFSLLSLPRSHLKRHFLVLGLLFGFILESYLHWLGKFWYFPYWDLPFYLIIFIPGFAFYFLYLTETYLGVKAVFEHFFLKWRVKKESFAGLKKIFVSLGLIGGIGLGFSTVYIALHTFISGNFQEFFSVNVVPQIDYKPLVIPMFIVGFSLWFLLEYLEYERHETSILYEMLKGNFWPLISVLVAAWLSAVLYEVFNMPSGVWRYTNIPLTNITFFQIPLIVYIAWPFHYIILFSLYRVLFKKETEEIWK